MELHPVGWVLLQVLTAAGSALLSFCIMSARARAAVAKEQAALAEIRAALRAADVLLGERVRAVEQEILRKSLEDFIQDIHVEERHWVRDRKVRRTIKKMLVSQERLCFRNIPLSTWIEYEMTVEEASSPSGEDRRLSVFPTSQPVREREVLRSGTPPACSTPAVHPCPAGNANRGRSKAKSARRSGKLLVAAS